MGCFHSGGAQRSPHRLRVFGGRPPRGACPTGHISGGTCLCPTGCVLRPVGCNITLELL